MFERATRLKIRFDTPKGQLTVEDLWDLPLTSETHRANLDEIAIALNVKLTSTSTSTTSFVKKDKKPDEVTQLAFDIVKHVIDIRLEEQKLADEARARAKKKQQILGLIARKEDEKLETASLEELRALAESI